MPVVNMNNFYVSKIC